MKLKLREIKLFSQSNTVSDGDKSGMPGSSTCNLLNSGCMWCMVVQKSI